MPARIFPKTFHEINIYLTADQTIGEVGNDPIYGVFLLGGILILFLSCSRRELNAEIPAEEGRVRSSLKSCTLGSPFLPLLCKSMTIYVA